MTPDLGNYDTVLAACRDWRDRQIALKAANQCSSRRQKNESPGGGSGSADPSPPATRAP
jgi:hypothetical protein